MQYNLEVKLGSNNTLSVKVDGTPSNLMTVGAITKMREILPKNLPMLFRLDTVTTEDINSLKITFLFSDKLTISEAKEKFARCKQSIEYAFKDMIILQLKNFFKDHIQEQSVPSSVILMVRVPRTRLNGFRDVSMTTMMKAFNIMQQFLNQDEKDSLLNSIWHNANNKVMFISDYTDSIFSQYQRILYSGASFINDMKSFGIEI